MSEPATESDPRFKLRCFWCHRVLLARQSWVGRDVECPHCQASMSVPEPVAGDEPTPGKRPSLVARRFFNFPCARCDSLLEGHTGMSGQPGRCPTCGARFVVPSFNPRTNKPTRAKLLEDDGAAPMPVHAYGSSGAQAPRIVRDDDGTSMIVCPKCEEYNDHRRRALRIVRRAVFDGGYPDRHVTAQ